MGHDLLFSTKMGYLPRSSPAMLRYSSAVTGSVPPTLMISAGDLAIPAVAMDSRYAEMLSPSTRLAAPQSDRRYQRSQRQSINKME
jgi:hypothetical protein